MAYQGIQIHQIRAARSLLDWTQDDLAARTGLSKFSIANLEGGKTSSQKKTIDKIIKSLELAGVEFIDEGVRLKKDSLIIIDGEDWYLRLLDDIHHSLLNDRNKELLIEFANQVTSSDEIIDKVASMRIDGISMRLIIEDNTTPAFGLTSECHRIPICFSKNNISFIYADKIAVCTENNSKVLVIRDSSLAQTRRNMFDITWNFLKNPTYIKDKKKAA